MLSEALFTGERPQFYNDKEKPEKRGTKNENWGDFYQGAL